jgi:hypothetical protein
MSAVESVLATQSGPTMAMLARLVAKAVSTGSVLYRLFQDRELRILGRLSWRADGNRPD